MLKTIVYGCLLLTIHLNSFAQSCLPDGIHITRQGQIDSFKIRYPGCTIIEEDLRITGQNIVNLNGINHIEVINRDLIIIGTNLYNFNALNSLKKICGLTIWNNPNLTDLNFLFPFDSLEALELISNLALTNYLGLSNLEYVDYISLTNIPITDINIFPSLTNFNEILFNNLPLLVRISEFPDQPTVPSSEREIRIVNNPVLQDLSGFAGWTHVHMLKIDNNDNLINLSGLNTFKEMNWLELRNNEKLTDISALASLEKASSTIIVSNATLPNIDGLENIKNSSIQIQSNPMLTDINAVQHMTHITGLYFRNLPIVDLTGLTSIDSIFGDIGIFANPSLTSLKGLDSLKFVEGSVSISANPALISLNHLNALQSIKSLYLGYQNLIKNLSGLQSLRHIDQTLSIHGNFSLTSLNGLGSIDTLHNNLFLFDNPELGDISPLTSIGYIGGHMSIDSISALTALPIFTYLDHIKGNLEIIDNQRLQSVAGFAHLKTVDGDITIRYNPVLKSLEGFDKVQTDYVDSLTISQNPSLSTCQNTFVCRHIDLGNPAYISDNAIGCSSIPEVDAQCTILADEVIKEEEISCFPNPTRGVFEIHGLVGENSSIHIIDSYGMPDQSWIRNGSSIDMTSSPNGCYYVLIRTKAGLIVSRLIKL